MALLDKFKKKNKPEIEKKEKEPVKEQVIDGGIKKPVRGKAEAEKLVQAYGVIKEPHITEKAGILTEQGKYVFKVSIKANKTETKKAVEALYGVKVEKVHMIHSAPKRRRLGRHQGWRGGLEKGFKKAVVTLEKGEKIELLPR